MEIKFISFQSIVQMCQMEMLDFVFVSLAPYMKDLVFMTRNAKLIYLVELTIAQFLILSVLLQIVVQINFQEEEDPP